MIKARLPWFGLFFCVACATEKTSVVRPEPSGGQAAPKAEEPVVDPPKEFAPGVISTGRETAFTFGRRGRTIWLLRKGADGKQQLLRSKLAGEWSPAEPVIIRGVDANVLGRIAMGGTDSFLLFDQDKAGGGDAQRDLWMSYRIAGVIYPPRKLTLLSQTGLDGGASIDADTNLYFHRDVGGQLDLFAAKRSATDWREPVALKALNTAGDEFDPCVAPNGFLLIHAARPQGGGNSDLMASVRNAVGWAPSVRLVGGVNTEGNETSPVISPDGKTLMFNRDGKIFAVPLAGVVPE